MKPDPTPVNFANWLLLTRMCHIPNAARSRNFYENMPNKCCWLWFLSLFKLHNVLVALYLKLRRAVEVPKRWQCKRVVPVLVGAPSLIRTQPWEHMCAQPCVHAHCIVLVLRSTQGGMVRAKCGWGKWHRCIYVFNQTLHNGSSLILKVIRRISKGKLESDPKLA